LGCGSVVFSVLEHMCNVPFWQVCSA
jgi:hypothetical protein